MSKDKSEKEPKAKSGGKGMLMKVLMGVGLIGAGGGGAFGLVQSGILGGGEEVKKQDNNPKLIRKGEEDPYAVKAEGEKEGAGAKDVDGEGGSEYRTSYYNFSEEFTSNLRDSEALVQTALAASTRRDGRVLMWMKKHELAIRSEMLTVIADTPEEDVYSIVGKERMQKRLTAAINKVLVETEGFGGVDAVYFKAFIIQ